MLYAKLIHWKKLNKVLPLFRTKGKPKGDPFDYLNQYCKVKLALIVERIYISETTVSIQMNFMKHVLNP